MFLDNFLQVALLLKLFLSIPFLGLPFKFGKDRQLQPKSNHFETSELLEKPLFSLSVGSVFPHTHFPLLIAEKMTQSQKFLGSGFSSGLLADAYFSNWLNLDTKHEPPQSCKVHV